MFLGVLGASEVGTVRLAYVISCFGVSCFVVRDMFLASVHFMFLGCACLCLWGFLCMLLFGGVCGSVC